MDEVQKRFENVTLYMLSVPQLMPYGTILSRVNLIECENTQIIPTLGVRLNGRSVELFYNPEFIKEQSNKQLVFLLLHEIYHVMFHHITRADNCSNHKAANYVQDAIINDSILQDSMLSSYIDKPVENGTFSGITHDTIEDIAGAKYNGLDMFEPYYKWFKDKIADDSQYSQQEGDGSGDTPSNQPGSSSKVGFDCHLQNNCTDEEAQIIAGEFINEVKSRGNIPGALEKHLASLEKQPDYLKVIKKVISNHVLHGCKKKTFARPHIYGIEGLKGNIYRQYQINCILDTSGSMFSEIDFVLGFLYRNKVTVTLIQIDTEIKSVQTFKDTKAVVDMETKGFGGTELQPALDYIAKDKNLRNYCNLILTDGYTDTLNFRNINKQTLIISTEIECPTQYAGNKVQQLIIKR